MGKLLYKAFGEIKKHFLTDHFGRSEIFLGKKTPDDSSQCMESDKLEGGYIGALRVQKREGGITLVHDYLRMICQRGGFYLESKG